jgi:cobalamin biosynthesis Mg chelatase CobN
MRRLLYIAALALMAMLMLAPGAMAQQMPHQHMMSNGQMMDDNMMASPSASASPYPSASATGNGSAMRGTTMASPSASASVSPSATASTSASASPSATTTAASAPRSHHHGGGVSSASAAVGGRLPSTGGLSWVSSLVSVGALALLGGFGFVAARLLRRNY